MPTVSDSDARAHEAYLARTRFSNLDGIRALCIAAVLWHHAPLWAGMEGQVWSRGFLGVDFFFVLSGFLITTLLLRERDRTGRISLAGFYARRARRILPPYLFLVGAVSAWYIGVQGRTEYLELLPYYLLFLANFLTTHIPLLSPMWSLAVEEQYYLLWPLLLILLPPRALLPVLALGIAVNVAGIMGAFAPFGIEGRDLGPLRIALPAATYAPILMGSAGAIWLHGPRGFALARRLLGQRAAGPLLLLAVVAAAALTPEDLRGLPNLLIHSLMLAALLAVVLREDNLAAPFLTAAPVARFGEISYGIYLYHLVALDLAARLLGGAGIASEGLLVLLYVLLSVLIAEASFRTLEAWFRRRPARTAAA